MSLRLFAALEIPDDVAAGLTAMQRGIGGARWAPRENLHLTLAFFGDMAEPVAEDLDLALADEARGRAAFDIQLKGAGFFGKNDPHALYVGVAENGALRALAADIERAARRCGVRPEARRYTPHVTIAYLNRPELERVTAFEQSHALFESRVWLVDRFGLFSSLVRRSAPSLYRLETEYELTA
jgi:2'-5' RNA ligase